jgi:hypothetical protein
MRFICHEQYSANRMNSLKDCVVEDSGTGASSKISPQESVLQFWCQKYQEFWAGGSRIITANYFFWNSGIPLQMSKEGLLRSLLFQILRQSPELIQTVSPGRWEFLCLFNEDDREWTKRELEQMLRTAAGALGATNKLCIFEDGLDEFDGRHDDLVHPFKALIGN